MIDNKFEHNIECLSPQCVGRNEIPPVEAYENFVLNFDIEYKKISPLETGISSPILCINYRRKDPRNFYVLCIKSNGWYRMARYLNGELTVIRDWERTPVLYQGIERNSISLIANREIYQFKANGMKVAEFEDENLLSASEIEFVIYSYQNIPDQKSEVKLELDNIEIIDIP